MFGMKLAYAPALVRLLGYMAHSHVDNGLTFK